MNDETLVRKHSAYLLEIALEYNETAKPFVQLINEKMNGKPLITSKLSGDDIVVMRKLIKLEHQIIHHVSELAKIVKPGRRPRASDEMADVIIHINQVVKRAKNGEEMYMQDEWKELYRLFGLMAGADGT